MCLSILLHRTVKDMIEENKSGSSLTFGPGKLKELCKLLPDEGEVLVTAAFTFVMFCNAFC